MDTLTGPVDTPSSGCAPLAAQSGTSRDSPDPTAAAARRTHVRPREGWQAIDVLELWRARDLLWIFTLRDIRVRYKQTFFGFAWALFVPVIQVLVFTVVFGALLGVGDRVNRAAGRDLPYPLFALTGQIVWNLFKMTIDGASTSLLGNAEIIRKIYVPRLLLPFAALGRPAIDTAMVWVLMISLALWYSMDTAPVVKVTAAWLLSPLFLAGSIVPALGLGLIVAAATVTYRDLQQVMPFLVSILFFATPVIYSVELLPDRLAWLMYLNPAAGFVQAHRAAVMDLPIEWIGVAISMAISAVLLVFGLFYFARAERRFADVG